MSNKIVIKQSKIKGAGRGVFATADIKKNEVIEICPILVFSKEDTANVMESMLSEYVYAYDDEKTIFVLGFGSLYNHSNTANAKYEIIEHEGQPEQNNQFCFTALKPIKKNEEIYINYGKDHFGE